MSIIDTTKMDLLPEEISQIIMGLALSHYICTIQEMLETEMDIPEEEKELLNFILSKSIELESEIRSKLNLESNEEDKQEI